MRMNVRESYTLGGFESKKAAHQGCQHIGIGSDALLLYIHRAFSPRRFHGSSRSISPDRYLQNSGLRSVGSSHGVSSQKFRCISLKMTTTPTPCEKGEQNNTHTPYVNGFSLIRLVEIQLLSSADSGIKKYTRSYLWSNIGQATTAFAKGTGFSRL